MPPHFQAYKILKDAGIINGIHTCRYLGVEGGNHQFMVGGYYYAVDLVIGKWRQTA